MTKAFPFVWLVPLVLVLSASGQGLNTLDICQEPLLECRCHSTRGIDWSGSCGCEYFTRGRPEYEDLCGSRGQPAHYLSLLGGLSVAENLERNQVGQVPDFLGASLVEGGVFGFSIGRQWNSRVRTELEFSYGNNNAEDWFERTTVGNLLITSSVAATGELETYSGLANLVFDLTPRRIALPNVYAGLGGGVSHGKGLVLTATDLYRVDDASLAWQFLVGGNYALRRNLDLFTEYHYLLADNFTVNNQTTGTGLGDFEYRSHNVFLGLRFRR